MKKIKVVLLDDEQDALKLLSLELLKISDTIEITGTFTDAIEAVHFILKNPPDLLFLDVEMPRLNGFEVLDKLQDIQCSVVFVTAYDRYAIKAFRYHALDYITKPIDSGILMETVLKAKEKQMDFRQYKDVEKSIRLKITDKIAVPTSRGILFLNLNEICCIEAADNYAVFHLSNKTTVMCSRTLKEIHQMIDDTNFMRIHRQYVVNLNQVVQLNRTESNLILSNEMEVPVSRDQKEHLLDRFKRQ